MFVSLLEQIPIAHNFSVVIPDLVKRTTCSDKSINVNAHKELVFTRVQSTLAPSQCQILFGNSPHHIE